MSLRNVIRWSVVKTNPYWPFSALNRIPYSVALRSFLRSMRKFPEIKSIYIRHGLLRHNWVPAISDIDITVIIARDLPTAQEFSFLKSFWRKFKKLKSVFPMLGETDVLDELQFDVWRKFSIRGHESKNWLLIYGDNNLLQTENANPETSFLDSLDYAFINYLNIFLKRLFQKNEDTTLFKYEMSRLASKIVYYVNYGQEVEFQNEYSDTFSLVSAILRKFDESLSQHFVASEAVESSITQPSDLGRELGEFSNEIYSILLSHNRDVVILKENLRPEQFAEFVSIIRKAFRDRKTPPAIVNRNMFEYMMQVFEPFLYSHLRQGKIVYGVNPFSGMQPPERSSCVRSVIMQTANVLAFPQTSSLVSPNEYSAYSERTLDSMLEHALFIKLYLENGFIKSNHEELLCAAKEYYPGYQQRLLQLKQSSADDVESFAFWKDLSKEIYTLKPHSMAYEWKH